MLNQDKIRLMTKIAIYEQNEGKEDRGRMTYFKNDYVVSKTFGVLVGVTIALVIIFAFDFGIQVLNNLATVTEFDFLEPAKQYLTIWIGFMVVYAIVSAFYNRIDYFKSEKRVNEYQKHLKQLEKID